jgi:glucosamine--fructose-6-phosphate aminotransferase (isomerizing)
MAKMLKVYQWMFQLLVSCTSSSSTTSSTCPTSEQFSLGGIKAYVLVIKRCRKLLMIACGTSYHSCFAFRQFLEELTERPVMVGLASDFLDRGALIIGFTNTLGSTICRESHSGVHITVEPEFGVASIKAYTSQVLCLIRFALVMCEDRISLQPGRSEIIQGLKQLPDQIRRMLELDDKVLAIAKELPSGCHSGFCWFAQLQIPEQFA